MSAPKRPRGRPRKPRVTGSGFPSMPFKPAAPDKVLGADDAKAVASRLREYAEEGGLLMLQDRKGADEVMKQRKASSRDKDLVKWIKAAADAVERGDATRAAHYMLSAIRHKTALVYADLFEFACAGAEKLKSDKKRGRRVAW